MEKIKEFRNDLLKRKEIAVIEKFDENPGIEKSKKMIVDELKLKEDCVVIKKIKSKFGSDSFEIIAFIYDSVEDLKRIEREKKKNG